MKGWRELFSRNLAWKPRDLLLTMGTLAILLVVAVSDASATPLVTPISSATAPIDWAVSANGSVITYEITPKRGEPLVYLWIAGRVRRVDSSRIRAYWQRTYLGYNLNGGGVAISPDGKWIAYAALSNGRPGTAFYNVATHARTFLPNYILDTKVLGLGINAQAMSSNGQYVLLTRGLNERHTGPFGIYNRGTGHFALLPSRPGLETIGLNLSANGNIVLFAELKAYAGQKSTVIYNTTTHHQTTLPWLSEQTHWLSEDGMFALTNGGPHPQYWVTRYSVATASVSGPPSTRGISLEGSSINFNGGINDTVALSGDGNTIEFVCSGGIDLYSFTTGEYSVLLPVSSNLKRASLSADGNHVVFAGQHGLYEISTASASQVGGLPPATCAL